MHASSAGFDHRFHQFERVQHAAKAGFRIGDDRGEPVDAVLAFRVMNLVGANERVIDATDDAGDAVCRIKRLIGIHFAGKVGVRRDLPAGKINRLESGLDLLHGLVARKCAKSADESLLIEQVPQFFGTAARERVLDGKRSAQTIDIGGGVGTLYTSPARVIGPILPDSCDFQIAGHSLSPIGRYKSVLFGRNGAAFSQQVMPCTYRGSRDTSWMQDPCLPNAGGPALSTTEEPEVDLAHRFEASRLCLAPHSHRASGYWRNGGAGDSTSGFSCAATTI